MEEQVQEQVQEQQEQQVTEKPEKKRRFKHRWVGILLNCVIGFFGTLIMVFGVFLIYASATTLKTKDIERVKVGGNGTQTLYAGVTTSILTWNVGYCALDETADFFMDGGTEVRAHSAKQVKENMTAIVDKINELDPDICFVQEVDVESDRSMRVAELKYFNSTVNPTSYNHAFAANYKAGYVPYPLPTTLGKVYSGISTWSKFEVTSAARHQLPIPFKWPVSLLNLKRCLLVERIPVQSQGKELVIINLHLEAYSEAEGKTKQLKQMFNLIDKEIDKGNYVIAGGDFNQAFSSIDRSMYPLRNKDYWQTPVIDTTRYSQVDFLMDNTHPTCRLLNKKYKGADKDTFQYYMIDGFICSHNVEVETINTLDLQFKNSDHNPVLMNFHLLPSL